MHCLLEVFSSSPKSLLSVAMHMFWEYTKIHLMCLSIFFSTWNIFFFKIQSAALFLSVFNEARFLAVFLTGSSTRDWTFSDSSKCIVKSKSTGWLRQIVLFQTLASSLLLLSRMVCTWKVCAWCWGLSLTSNLFQSADCYTQPSAWGCGGCGGWASFPCRVGN